MGPKRTSKAKKAISAASKKIIAPVELRGGRSQPSLPSSQRSAVGSPSREKVHFASQLVDITEYDETASPHGSLLSKPVTAPHAAPSEDDELFRLVEHRRKNQQINPHDVAQLSQVARTSSGRGPRSSGQRPSPPPAHDVQRSQAFTIFDIPVIVNSNTLTVSELRAELKARNLGTQGRREVLVMRLDAFIDEFEKERSKQHSGRTSAQLKTQ